MLETILHNRFAVTAVLLFGIGFMNLLLQQNLLKKVVGFNIMDSAVFMLLASLGYIEGRVAPVMGEGVTPDASLFINPSPAAWCSPASWYRSASPPFPWPSSSASTSITAPSR